MDINISELQSLKDCGIDKLKVYQLNLMSPERDIKNVNKEARKFLAELLISSNEADISKALKDFIDKSIKKEWYRLQIQYEAAKRNLYNHLLRMGVYTSHYISDCNTVANKNWRIFINGKYRNVDISSIKGNIHLIVQRDSFIEGIIFCKGAPKESMYARNPENAPEMSIKICCSFAALREMYPDMPIKVSLFYLKNKKDKGTTLEPYESGKGSNVISTMFNADISVKDVLNASLGGVPKKDCKNCISSDCCNSKLNLNIRVESEAPKNNDVSKHKTVSETQKQIIEFKEGILNVEAVPGAGKTFCLVKRISELIRSGINPKDILMVTFTKKACMEIEQRVQLELGTSDPTQIPTMQTFHSLGYTILRANSSQIKLASVMDKKKIIEQSLQICYEKGIIINNVNYDLLTSRYGLLNSLLEWFDLIESNREIFISNFKGKKDIDNILKVYDVYSRIKDENMYITYDEQISLVNKMFDDNPFMTLKYINQFRFIMVDEYQDINKDQFEMIRKLSGCGNLLTVGDLDQSIYGFRGSDSRFSLNFTNYFPEAKTVFMTDNYRCSGSIVNVANTLINHNKERFEKFIKSHRAAGTACDLYSNMDEAGICSLINELEHEYKPGEIAVISRNNSALSKFGKIISPDGNLSPKDYMIDDVLFNSIYCLLYILFEGPEKNDIIVYKALRYINSKEISIKKPYGVHLYSFLLQQGLFPNLIGKEPFKNGNDLWDTGVVLWQCLHSLNTIEKPEEALSALVNIMYGVEKHPVISVLSQMADERNIKDLHGYYVLMKNMIEYEDNTRVGYSANMNTINLLTAHDSKGKEFPCVIVYGIDEFVPDEEERRLLYVALTRAKEKLIVIQNAVSNNMLIDIKNCLNEHKPKKGLEGGNYE